MKCRSWDRLCPHQTYPRASRCPVWPCWSWCSFPASFCSCFSTAYSWDTSCSAWPGGRETDAGRKSRSCTPHIPPARESPASLMSLCSLQTERPTMFRSRNRCWRHPSPHPWPPRRREGPPGSAPGFYARMGPLTPGPSHCACRTGGRAPRFCCCPVIRTRSESTRSHLTHQHFMWLQMG